MGEIFRRETAEHPEPFTGERLTAAIGGQVQIEHYHRYLFARSLVAGLDVLDVASGEGYGSALLAQVARSVIGAEYSGATVLAAAANFPRPNLRFLQSDARSLPLADASVDAVVSFETIEHFDRQEQFVREIRRVLRHDGIVVVSTPERDVYSPAGSWVNQFHVHELSGGEFDTLLRGAFRHVRMMRQRPLMGSALLACAPSAAPPLVFEKRGETHFEACVGLPRAPYLIAVASDNGPPALPPSLYIDRSDLDTDQASIVALTEQARERESGMQVQVAQLRDELARALATFEEARRDAENARRDAAEARRQAEDRRRDAEGARRNAEDARQRAAAIDAARSLTEQANQALQKERDLAEQRYLHLQGSLRSFLRLYVPRLRGHLFGQRP